MKTILVVDDEPQILRALQINLRVRKYEVYTAATGTEALGARCDRGGQKCVGSVARRRP